MTTENSAVRGTRRGCEAMLSGDINGYADLLAEDFTFEDRRSGLQLILRKREAVDQARATADLSWESYEIDVLEVRGDRTALIRQTWHVGGFETVILTVLRVDAEERSVASILFDDEDFDAARAELEVQATAQ